MKDPELGLTILCLSSRCCSRTDLTAIRAPFALRIDEAVVGPILSIKRVSYTAINKHQMQGTSTETNQFRL